MRICLPSLFHDRAGDLAVFLHEADGRRRRPQRYVAVPRRSQQPRRQRIAVDEACAASVQQHVAAMRQHARSDEGRRFQRTRRVEEMLQIRAAVQSHAHERQFPHRLRQHGQISAELAAVERQRMDRPAFLDAAGMIGMIVRVVLAEGEFYFGIRLEKAHHRAGIFEKRADAAGIEVIARLVPDVSCRPLDGVVDAGPPRERIARHPEPSARSRGSAAELRSFLHHQDVAAEMLRGNRRRHAGGAGADHQHVAGFAFHRHGSQGWRLMACRASASPISTKAEVTSGPPTRMRVGVFILFHS